MSNLVTKLLGDKREWKTMEARADALPPDYRIVYGEIKPYLWRFTSGDGMDIVAVLKEVLALFEAGAAAGEPALAVTGEDVAAFCDECLRGTASYADQGRASLNRDIMRKLEHAEQQG